MNEKIIELKKLCETYNLQLNVQYYCNEEVCFVFLNENEDEVFNVVVWYHPKDRKRIFYIEVNSQYEQWRGGHFTKEDMLLLLSIDDLSDKELNIEPKKEEIYDIDDIEDIEDDDIEEKTDARN